MYLIPQEEAISSASNLNDYETQQTRLNALLFAKQNKLVNLKHCFYHEESDDNILDEDTSTEKKHYFCTVEPLTGFISLRSLLDHHSKSKTPCTPLDAKYIKQVIKRVGKSLSVLHAINQPYGDVSPRNILVHKRSGKVILRPFGVRWEEFKGTYVDPYSLDASDNKYSMLEFEERIEWYCAPESVYSNRFLQSTVWTKENDMWSLGCVLAEMLIVDHPIFSGFDNLDQAINMIDILGVPSKSALPSSLRELYASFCPISADQCKENIRKHIQIYANVQLCATFLEVLFQLFCYDMGKRMSVDMLQELNLHATSLIYTEVQTSDADAHTVFSTEYTLPQSELIEESLELASLLNEKRKAPEKMESSAPIIEPSLPIKLEPEKAYCNYSADVSIVTRLLQNVRRELKKLQISNKQQATLLREVSKTQLSSLKKKRKVASSVSSEQSFVAETKISQLVVTIEELRGDCSVSAAYFSLFWDDTVKRVRRGATKLRVLFKIDKNDVKCWEKPLKIQVIDEDEQYIGECTVDVYLLGLNQQNFKQIEGWYTIGDKINGEVKVRCAAYSASEGIKSVVDRDKRDILNMTSEQFALGSHIINIPETRYNSDQVCFANDSKMEYENELFKLQRLQSDLRAFTRQNILPCNFTAS